MTQIDWSAGLGTVPSPISDEEAVLAALRRRRYGDPDSWAHAAVLALIAAFGLVIAVAGTAGHRLVLATAAPTVAAPAIAWCRQRRTARRLQSGVRTANPDALAETPRFLDRPDEGRARVSALRLAATYTEEAFEAAIFAVEATDAEGHPRPPARTSRAEDIAVTSYCLILGLVVVGAWAVELRS